MRYVVAVALIRDREKITQEGKHLHVESTLPQGNEGSGACIIEGWMENKCRYADTGVPDCRCCCNVNAKFSIELCAYETIAECRFCHWRRSIVVLLLTVKDEHKSQTEGLGTERFRQGIQIIALE